MGGQPGRVSTRPEQGVDPVGGGGGVRRRERTELCAAAAYLLAGPGWLTGAAAPDHAAGDGVHRFGGTHHGSFGTRILIFAMMAACSAHSGG